MKIHFNGLHITGYVQGNSRWQCPTWFWYLLWHLLALGPHSDSHSMQLHRGLPSTHTGFLLVGCDRGGATYVQKEKTGQALQLLSEQGSSVRWIFYGPEGIQHPLRFGLWPLAKSSYPPCFILKSTQPAKQQPGDGRQLGNSPIPIHKALLILSTAPVDTISSFSIVSVGGRSGLHHFPRVTLQKRYSAKE